MKLPDGGYEVHVIKKDGSGEVHVLVDEDFNVTGTETGRGGPPPGGMVPPAGAQPPSGAQPPAGGSGSGQTT